MTTKLEEEGVKALVVGPLKNNFLRLPLYYNYFLSKWKKNIEIFYS